MKTIFLWMICGSIWTSAFAHAESFAVSFHEMPRVSMRDVVHAFMRVAWSEGDSESEADENIVYQAFESQTNRAMSRGRLRAFMRQMAAYSNRTFPEGSPYVKSGRTARTVRQRWISQIPYDCEASPLAWPTAAVAWAVRGRDPQTGRRTPAAQERCKALRKRTWHRLRGEIPNWCQARVRHWGDDTDVENPRRGGWVAVTCDQPERVRDCAEIRRMYPGKRGMLPSYCARNLAWCVPRRGPCEPDSEQSFAALD